MCTLLPIYIPNTRSEELPGQELLWLHTNFDILDFHIHDYSFLGELVRYDLFGLLRLPWVIFYDHIKEDKLVCKERELLSSPAHMLLIMHSKSVSFNFAISCIIFNFIQGDTIWQSTVCMFLLLVHHQLHHHFNASTSRRSKVNLLVQDPPPPPHSFCPHFLGSAVTPHNPKRSG